MAVTRIEMGVREDVWRRQIAAVADRWSARVMQQMTQSVMAGIYARYMRDQTALPAFRELIDTLRWDEM